MTVTEFVLARIAEDEAMARAASGYQLEAGYSRMVSGRLMVHPARVLAQCAAMRKIVELAAFTEQAAGNTKDRWFHGEALAASSAVHLLASIWSDHPDFNPSWA